jgi:CBS domain-containing protein
LGFANIYDLVGGRAAWTVLGLPTEGQIGDARRISHYMMVAPSVNVAGTLADVRSVAVADWPTAVVSDDGVLLGAVAATARGLPPGTAVDGLMIPAPGTIRPDLRVDEVIERLHKDQIDHVYVTTASGVLMGIVVQDELHV